METNERLLTIAELATYLDVSPWTIYDWRHKGLGPRGYKVGRGVRYRSSDVEAWLEERSGM
jgi:excisionase family DNA binding protein